jgi:hypothetical protein
VHGPIGRKLKKTPIFKLVRKAFFKEVEIFNKRRPAPAIDKNSIFVHPEDAEEVMKKI